MGFRCLLLLLFLPVCCAEESKAPKKKSKPVAGKADVLRHVKKKFAAFKAYDLDAHSVRLHVEGEDKISEWNLLPDAECRIHGWWGRPGALPENHRVWVWFAVDRQKKPAAILMIADELSEQDIHGDPWTIEKVEEGKVRVHQPDAKRSKPRELSAPGRGLEAGQVVYLQTVNGAVQAALKPDAFAALRAKQQERLREIWRKEGLPGMVSIVHPLSGEMEVLLDHEAMRWARHLRNGDKVTFTTQPEIKATVRKVEPWRERTRLSLVTNSGLDQAQLQPAQRIGLRVPEPPKDIRDSHLPTDIGRRKDRQARIDWFLASTYCTCAIAGDRCTGMFYSLASCNRNACGMPNEMIGRIGKMIDEGKTDREIFAVLEKERHRDLWMPHLLR